MNETVKRAIFGSIYVTTLWTCTYYSEISFSILFGILGLASLYEMWKLRKGKTKIVAFLYVITPFILIQLFGILDHNYPENAYNPSIILLLFILTWTFDTFAYLFGVKYGKHKMFPSISPKKSWEGFFGGMVFTIIAGIISQFYFRSFFENIKLELIIIFSIILPFTATLGDFIESYFKRKANVKDSGNIIPGHGGILDRMDAFMITIPVLYILINLFK
jgi:phosphatidate cytidylyltransferase